MPLLIVPSHHDSPKTSKGMFSSDYPLNSPSKKTFLRREQKGSIGAGVVVPTVEALDKILVSPEHSFRSYDFKLQQQSLSTDFTKGDERDFSEKLLDNNDPACQHFRNGQTSGSPSIGLVSKDSQYSDYMRALIEIMGDLPIVPVLQAYLFDPKNYDEFNAENESDIELTQEMLSSIYQHGMLAYPKRVWPEFYHAHTGESILRISHHPDKDNSPHYNDFATDPRLGNIEESDDMTIIVEKIKATLMPIIEEKIQKINDSHERVSEKN